MPYDANQIAKAKKSRGKRKDPAPSVSGGYAWGDGKGKVHSRPKRSGAQLGKAKDQKRLSDPDYFTQPMTLGEAQREGQRAAGLTYDPQISQVQLQQRQVPAWFDQYRQSLQTPAQVQQAYQPAIQAQQAVAQETGKTTQGVDPNSSAGQQDALAAKAREALVNLGTGVLTAGQQADTTYFQGRKGVADAAQIGMNTQLGSQLGSLQGQKGAAVAQYVGDARTAERNYGLAAQHQTVENKAFNVDTAVKAANIRTDRQKIRQTAKQKRQDRRDKGNEVITSGALAGKTKKWVRDHPNESSQLVTTYNKKAGSGPKAESPASVRAEKNRVAGIREKSGKALGRLDTAKESWELLKKSKITTGKKDSGGNDVTRPITPSDIKSELIKRGYSANEIHLMLMLRVGKKWGPKEVRMAHQLGIRVPRKYLLNGPPAPGDR